jgi:small subunit ribosomal protein S11
MTEESKKNQVKDQDIKKKKTDKEISDTLKEAVKVEKKDELIEEEVKKDSLGLEELPEEIKKKLEKKKSENTQKGKKTKKRKKKVARKVSVGKAYIKATYNNTIVTLTDLQGNVISWASAGIAGFKGPKKSTPYAASIITRLAVGKAKEDYGLQEVSVYIKGVGTGRESAVRALNNNGLIVTLIKDVTPVPHNGCRQRRPRRV